MNVPIIPAPVCAENRSSGARLYGGHGVVFCQKNKNGHRGSTKAPKEKTTMNAKRQREGKKKGADGMGLVRI